MFSISLHRPNVILEIKSVIDNHRILNFTFKFFLRCTNIRNTWKFPKFWCFLISSYSNQLIIIFQIMLILIVNTNFLTCILMILGSGCLVLAPPSMAIPKIDLVFLTVILRLPWWSGTTRAPSSSLLSDISLLVNLWALWCLRGGPPAPPAPAVAAPEPPSSRSWASCMSKLRESLCASSWNGHSYVSSVEVEPPGFRLTLWQPPFVHLVEKLIYISFWMYFRDVVAFF